MKYAYLVFIVLITAFTSSCASRQAKTDTPERAPPVSKSAPAKESAKKEKEVTKEAVKKEAPAEGEIVGKPAAGSKFAKLKIGMTLSQVEKLIGPPTKQWQHPTGKASIPFYFGADRWVIQYSYKHEGVLTLNSGGDQVLTRIEVNKAE